MTTYPTLPEAIDRAIADAQQGRNGTRLEDIQRALHAIIAGGVGGYTHGRGHLQLFEDDDWRYLDGTPVDDSRPCVECHLPHAPGGPDPCIGYLPGFRSVCCGHGGRSNVIVMPVPCLPLPCERVGR